MFSDGTVRKDSLLQPGGRHVWFTIFLELAWLILLALSVFMHTRFQMLIIIFSAIGVILSVLATDQSIYSSWGSLAAMGAGYLLLAIANLLVLLYYCFAYDNLNQGPVGAYEEKTTMYSPSATSNQPSAGGVIGSFPGSGLRNRFSMGKGPKTTEANTLAHSNVGAAAPVTSTGPSTSHGVHGMSTSASNLSAGGRPATDGPSDVAIGVPASSSAAGADAARAVDPALAEVSEFQNLNTSGNEVLTTNNYPPTYLNSSSTSTGLAPPITGQAGSQMSQMNTMEGATAVQMDAPQGVQRAEALYTYKASEDDPTEISFNKGDILQIVDSSGKWWQAQRPNGELGIVPSNYLRML